MRALIDLRDAQVESLDTLAKRAGQSRAALIRAAIDDYLAEHRCEQVADGFGLWGGQRVDGLVYQHKVREEW
jgi:metal-responsive CopG/Arc/MetJ family transcriptional regulator